MTSSAETGVPVVRVRGEATRRFPPDHAVLGVSVERRSADDRAAALGEAAATGSAVREALAGVAGVRSVALSTVAVHEASEWNPGRQKEERTGWVARLVGQVTVDDAVVGHIAGVVAATGGSISGVAWGLDDVAAARRETRVAAVAAAREAAEDFASAVDRQLGELRVLADSGLSGGGPQPFALASAHDTAVSAPVVVLDPEPVELYVAVEATYLLA